jgi:tetratricopeptide (TPR) repeat protein
MELRNDLLEETLAFYEGISAGRDAHEPSIRLDIASATAAAAGIQHDLGRAKQAEENLLRSVSLFEGLPRELREQPESRKGLIACYRLLGFSSYDRGQAAEAYFEKSLAEAEALVRTDPTNAEWQDELARVENSLGVYFGMMARYEQSARHYQQAVDIRERLLAGDPGPEAQQFALGENLINLGLTYDRLMKPEKAEAAFLRADGLLRPIVDAHPERYWLKISLAALESDWGNLLREKDLPRALEKLSQAVELADAALVQEPGFKEARTRSIETHGSRAVALGMANRLTEAIADWDRVVELAEEPKRAEHRANRAVALFRAGNHDRTLAEAYALASGSNLPDDYRYNVACLLALSAEPTKGTPCLGALANVASADLRARTAIRLLKQLKASGFFRKPDNTKYLTDDPDLVLIRSRPDFRPLLID